MVIFKCFEYEEKAHSIFSEGLNECMYGRCEAQYPNKVMNNCSNLQHTIV